MQDIVKEEITHYLDKHADENIKRGELNKIVQQAFIKMLRQIRMQDKTEREP